MIKKREIKPQTVNCYSPDNIWLGEFNLFEFNDLRIQIKKANISGYYAVYNDFKIEILSNGKILNWKEGLFDLFENQMMELL